MYGFAGGDPVNNWDPFGLSDCKKDSQADGSKDCPREADSQADGYKDCDRTSGAGCSPEYQRLLAADKPIEQAGQVLDLAVGVASGALAVRAGLLAWRARAATGIALASETGLGIMDGVRAQLPSGDHAAFVPTGPPRRMAVSTGTYLAIELIKNRLGIGY